MTIEEQHQPPWSPDEWVDIITDGSFGGGPGSGRWAWIARPQGHIGGTEIACAVGALDPTGPQSNNAAEIAALVHAVEWARSGRVNAVIHTDSLAVLGHANRENITSRRRFPRVIVRLVNRTYVADAHRLVSGKAFAWHRALEASGKPHVFQRSTYTRTVV